MCKMTGPGGRNSKIRNLTARRCLELLHSSNFMKMKLKLLCTAFLLFAIHLSADISNLAGTWSGTARRPSPPAIFCITADLQVNDPQFGGTFDATNCVGTNENHCELQGQLSGDQINLMFLNCSLSACRTTGTVNSSFNQMSFSTSCSDGSFTMSLNKNIAMQDVSTFSGISNRSVQTSGVQWIDYNNDGRQDLYLVGHNGNVLFKNVGMGKFVDVTAETHSGNNGKDATGASWADIDNDGDLDVFIANKTGGPTLLLNNKGVFQDITKNMNPSMAQSAAVGVMRGGVWVDINNDKKSDLFVIFDGAKNQLFLQTGNLDFHTNIAASAGVDYNGHARSAVAADFNGDGFQDLYIVNYGQPNRLYKNNGNQTFTDVTQSAGVGFSGKSVGVAAADYDNDQDLDLYVVNSDGPPALFRNLGHFKFINSTPQVLKTASKGTAAAFVDLDNDGDQDLIVTQVGAQNLLYENLGKGRFRLATGVDLTRPVSPSGVAIGDFNNDGIPDVVIGNADTGGENGDSLYKNVGGGQNSHLILKLKGTKSRRDAIGAQIVIQTGLKFQSRTILSGDGQSQQSLPQEFGLGRYPKVDRIQIKWPSGTLQEIFDVDANKTLNIIEP
ncbi:MAG: hypothetical protein C5B54_02945 [Acidobacteria bacterium]|nr:MAG: hypothetical protein C5B54_02945 [Acidobacteriota bacterium]